MLVVALFKFATIHIDVIFLLSFFHLSPIQESMKRLREVLTRDNPIVLSEVPKLEGIDKEKAAEISLTGDNFNTARLTKDISNDRLGVKSHNMDFQNHLRNTYLCTEVEKDLYKFLTE